MIRCRQLVFCLGALLASGGCGDPNAASGDGGDGHSLTLLTPNAAPLRIQPTETRVIRVQYADNRGAPVSAAQLSFAIKGQARGSTLSASSATSGTDGSTSVELHAGVDPTEFIVEVRAPLAPPLTLVVKINALGLAALEAHWQPSVPPPQATATAFLRISLHAGLNCRQRRQGFMEPPLRELRLPVERSSGQITGLQTELAYALEVTLYSSKQRADAWGCVDILAHQLLPRVTNHITVALAPPSLNATGAFTCTTGFRLSESGVALNQVLAGWQPFSQCRLGFGQALLDCLIDLIDEGDPEDCVVEDPRSVLALKLIAKRGTNAGGCRGETTPEGGVSAEALVAERLDASASESLQALAAVSTIATEVLSRFSLGSELALSAQSDQGRGSAEHRIQRITFFGHKSSQASYDLSAVASPQVSAAGIPYAITGTQLALEPHGFTLKLAGLLKSALGDVVLAPLGLPISADKVVASLTAKLAEDGSAVDGCGALDRLLCPHLEEAQGCIETYCRQAMQLLAKRLNRGFELAPDGTNDLRVGGTVEVTAGPPVDAPTQAIQTLNAPVSGAPPPGPADPLPARWQVWVRIGSELVDTANVSLSGQRLP